MQSKVNEKAMSSSQIVEEKDELHQIFCEGDLNKVWEIRALQRTSRQDEAKQILERIAKQVQPIMRKHNCPKRNELLGLNVNRGVEVKLRLRRPGRELEFYSFHEVLDTMLHELCHNSHGPHKASFYQLWDQLIKECEESMSKGISGTGEGFDFSGKCLIGFSRQQPLASLHKTTLAAAENRKRFSSFLSSGPLRLGGDKNIMSALSPVQAAAMAAERRLQDEIWCASVSGGFAEDLGDSDLLKQLYRVGQLLPVPVQMPLIVITYILELQDTENMVVTLANEIDMKNQMLDEMQSKVNEKALFSSQIVKEKGKLHQAFYEETCKMQHIPGDHGQRILAEQEKMNYDLELKKRQLDWRTRELSKCEVLTEREREKLDEEKQQVSFFLYSC